MPHPTLGEEVIAAVVRAKGNPVSANALTASLRESLAPYKIPRQIRFVETVPVGANGKVQRRTLAASLGLVTESGMARPCRIDPEINTEQEPTPLEAELQAVWAATLGLDHVGLNDNFFLLGGDSLQAVELFCRIEETLNRRLPRSALLEGDTVAAMARQIEAAKPFGHLVPIQAKGDRHPFFCVHNVGGDVLCYRLLSDYLGDAQPFYGLQKRPPRQ